MDVSPRVCAGPFVIAPKYDQATKGEGVGLTCQACGADVYLGETVVFVEVVRAIARHTLDKLDEIAAGLAEGEMAGHGEEDQNKQDDGQDDRPSGESVAHGPTSTRGGLW